MEDQIIEELKYWRKKSNGKHVDFKEKKEYYKRCYELCLAIEWQIVDLKALEDRVGITCRTIAEYAREYALKYSDMSEKEYDEQIYEKVYDRITSGREVKYLNSRVTVVLAKLNEMSLTDKEAIIEFLKNEYEQYHVSPYNLREKVDLFVQTYPLKERKKLLLSLDEKINIYIDDLKEKQLENNKKGKDNTQKVRLTKRQHQLELASKYIIEFIESDFSNIEEFCIDNKLDIEEMKELLEVCRKNDAILYKKYLSKLMVQKNQYNLDAITLGKQLICVIKNGVKLPTGETRNYDVIDYHNMINTNFEDTILAIADNLKVDELRTLKNFFNKNKMTFQEKIIEIEKIIEGKTKFGFSIKDSQNNIITYYPTKEEVELIINFLEENNIPLNEFNYRIALKRYLNNTLSLADNLRRGLTK